MDQQEKNEVLIKEFLSDSDNSSNMAPEGGESKTLDKQFDELTDDIDPLQIEDTDNKIIKTEDVLNYIKEDVNIKTIIPPTNKISVITASHQKISPKFTNSTKIYSKDTESLVCYFEGCGKTFTKKIHFNSHILIHKGEKPFICEWPKCEKSFTRQSELKRHAWIHNKSERFYCDNCNVKFSRADHLKLHKSTMKCNTNLEFMFNCNTCEKRFSHISDLSMHKTDCTNAIKLEVTPDLEDENGDLYSSYEGYLEDSKTDFIIQEDEEQDNKTVKENVKQDPARDDESEKFLQDQENEDLEQAVDDKPQKDMIASKGCGLCGKMFTGRNKNYILKRHMKNHSGDQDKIASKGCSLCGKMFPNNYTLNRHMTVHSGEKPFLCNQCEKCFSQKGWLKIHQKIHLVKSSCYQDKIASKGCSLCGKMFINNYNLNRHMTVHSGEKPFSCDQCERVFSQKGWLKIHQKIHPVKSSTPSDIQFSFKKRTIEHKVKLEATLDIKMEDVHHNPNYEDSLELQNRKTEFMGQCDETPTSSNDYLESSLDEKSMENAVKLEGTTGMKMEDCYTDESKTKIMSQDDESLLGDDECDLDDIYEKQDNKTVKFPDAQPELPKKRER